MSWPRQRYERRDALARLDPGTDFHEIYRQLALHEFPWDINQALSFALFRTYAVPSIGMLLHETGEFTRRVQKRYDDTGLLLESVLEHGFSSEQGRAAVRRINRMHRSYDISDDDMRYVLATFVVTPIRWLDDYGWRALTEGEKTASANYYRELGRHMGIPGIPATWRDFETLLDDYERERFGYDPGSRAVADDTLALLATFPPNHLAPRAAVDAFARSLMDAPLRSALAYRSPPKVVEALSRRALHARGKFVRFMAVRDEPSMFRDLPGVRSYPGGFTVEGLGTFPTGCPVTQGGDGSDTQPQHALHSDQLGDGTTTRQ
ncbi:oxygenase MpaB family protein [Pseudonocardia sp. N23]|uniref:oxygenase MpaB family protein n=1 Tax=Pseudonocardia sp. N23 TaxID=1987376 RepID=UPI000C037C81|nr:oxygenase MpaB family protein [Pseudonocardia sp. N23]GAY10225.1 hypothetical protein TOK_4581 [Pseudonocardia sp. N23]